MKKAACLPGPSDVVVSRGPLMDAETIERLIRLAEEYEVQAAKL